MLLIDKIKKKLLIKNYMICKFVKLKNWKVNKINLN